MKSILILVLLTLSVLAEPFSKGSIGLGLRLGTVSNQVDTYTVIGVTGNYFIIDDLSVGLGYESWFGGNPGIQKVSLESTYYAPLHEVVHPYLGLIYRRVVVESYPDTNSYGYRAGVAIVQKNIIVSVGIVQEKYDTERTILGDVQTYAELIVGASF